MSGFVVISVLIREAWNVIDILTIALSFVTIFLWLLKVGLRGFLKCILQIFCIREDDIFTILSRIVGVILDFLDI